MSTTEESVIPNRSETSVLKVLWNEGELSAREVHDRVGEAQQWACSTTRTILDRMVNKGLAERRSLHGIQVFSAAIGRAEGFAAIVKDFADRLLDGHYTAVVPLFVKGKRLSNEDLDELRALLEAEEDKR